MPTSTDVVTTYIEIQSAFDGKAEADAEQDSLLNNAVGAKVDTETPFPDADRSASVSGARRADKHE